MAAAAGGSGGGGGGGAVAWETIGLPAKLEGKSGALVDTSVALGAGVDYVGVYCSASWCGPCRAFTPALT